MSTEHWALCTECAWECGTHPDHITAELSSLHSTVWAACTCCCGVIFVELLIIILTQLEGSPVRGVSLSTKLMQSVGD